ncbi:uncharacterized protein LOC123718627 isoform X2 [Pieris brassicae]|uniref:uncharacterized protein LOC123718627 isoform X2 n=1 Tax=Pieris brassicae TaxID=7116 RepID=UPI001E65FD6B|nr:uncharacterized protein LOC123718627 isoform X2 [Pieris brassicae]
MSFRNYYDSSSYGRNRDAGRLSSSTADRPTALTTKYTTTSSIKSSSIPVASDRNSREETPISAITNRYASYSKNNTEKPTTTLKYEKKDYTKLSIPSVTSSKSRDVSPVTSVSRVSKYKRQTSPGPSLDRKITKSYKDKNKDIGHSDRDKDIPTKTDKTPGYSSLSNYKIYPRQSNYSRPVSRTDSKPEVSYTRPSSRTEAKTDINYSRPSTRIEKTEPSYNRSSTKTETKPEITVNRYAIANRLSSSSYLRSPTPIKRPTLSSINFSDNIKSDPDKGITPNKDTIVKENHVTNNKDVVQKKEESPSECKELETITVITRHTSPTPPGSSSYVRNRRADLAKTIEKVITRKKERPLCYDKEIQSDRLDDSTRSSRFAGSTRSSVTNWTYYSPNVPSYTGYAGRYSTQYSSLRENSYRDRCSRSRSKEPSIPDSHECNLSLDKGMNDTDCEENNTISTKNAQDIIVYDKDNDDETSEIIINVNLKLKKAKSPSSLSVTELIAPEITITNSQLPPQPPKSETTIKSKKAKQRKSSADSSSDSNSTKKLLKKRSKSLSSSDSDPGSEKPNNINKLTKLKKSKSNNKVQNGVISSNKERESNSLESSMSLSSSVSEDENVSKSKTSDSICISTDSSNNNSSTFQQKIDNGTEEAKSFLIRALAPVTNLFKLRNQESNENTKCTDNYTSVPISKDISMLSSESSSRKSKCNTNSVVASNDDSLVRLKAIRLIESNERSWWLESDQSLKNINENNEKSRIIDGCAQNSNEKQANFEISENNDYKDTKKLLYIDEEKPWWLDSSANIPEGIERLTPPRRSSSEEEKSDIFDVNKLRNNKSGEQRDWRHANNENKNNTDLDENIKLNRSSSDQRIFSLRRIRHIESGERPWWLSSDKNIPEGIEKLPTPPPQEESESSDSDEVEVYVPSSQIPRFPLNLTDDEPLGDRRSPEGLESPNEPEIYTNRHSPYENNRYLRRNMSYSKNAKYISRYTDIDEILGTANNVYSPFMDSIRSNAQNSYDDEECKEIDPTQVRIHDSTPQMPVIRKLHSRGDLINYEKMNQLDDATLQVFKDGDYGPYLDLDLTLAEQDEEIEGLQESRKNALVLRTQLSVRVHAITERLLHSQGKDLRRALFAVKQMLQSDKDLVHEFVANNGLDCLMQVSAKEDQTYLDYILRALGQILIYVDGMHGVMNHKGCIQWQYSLISSNFRHVVKTTLKLLSIFVEYTEGNSLLLIDAMNVVEKSNGRSPWYNVIKILQDFDASDTELLICATSLINLCLINIPDKNTYYDQVDALHDQGIDDIIQFYMSRQGTDLDLLRQLHIYDAVLIYEDGMESGSAVKQLDDSILKSIRRRNINVTNDFRKSKRYQMKEKGNQRYTSGLQQRIENGTLGHSVNPVDNLSPKWNKFIDTTIPEKDDRGILLNREHSIKDLAQRLTSPIQHVQEEKPLLVSDMAGIVSKAKEELARSQTKEIVKTPTKEKCQKTMEFNLEIVSEKELNWDEVRKACRHRDFQLCDLDFSDLREDSDDEAKSVVIKIQNGPPPPPPNMPPSFEGPPPPPVYGLNEIKPQNLNESDTSTLKKNKKTLKLFWREIHESPAPTMKEDHFIWDDLPKVEIDTAMWEHLFETRPNDINFMEKIQAEPKENLILDNKRSTAINITMKKLPPPQTIKAAILKMDVTVMARESIEKLLTILPTEEEKIKIQEAQYSNPDLPLGSAEQFLLTLTSINELSSRLKLWVFKLDFDNLEKEIAEPLMDLKQGIELLRANRTFKIILSTLREVGSFLNGTPVKGFRLEYLTKVAEVKDTVHKHSLLFHLCEMIKNKFEDTTDLFSELGPVIRASKVDFDVLSNNLLKLEADCKAAWDHMKRVAKHDGSLYKMKINDFITDAAERIVLLSKIKNLILKRYEKFLLYLGVPQVEIPNNRPTDFLKGIAEFALEYRTTRERLLQQIQKKATHRERNKTRGVMIIDVTRYSKQGDHSADTALKEILKEQTVSDILADGRRRSQKTGDDAVEEILESLVRSAAMKTNPQRERRRNRLSDRKKLVTRTWEMNST